MLRKSIIINQRKRKNQPTATITSKEHSIVFFVKIKQKRSTGKRLSTYLSGFVSFQYCLDPYPKRIIPDLDPTGSGITTLVITVKKGLLLSLNWTI